jgi:L-iditol 2-dehydrogenase
LIEPLAAGLLSAKQGGARAGQIAFVTGALCIGLVSLMSLKADSVNKVYVVDIMQKSLNKALDLPHTALPTQKSRMSCKRS